MLEESAGYGVAANPRGRPATSSLRPRRWLLIAHASVVMPNIRVCQCMSLFYMVNNCRRLTIHVSVFMSMLGPCPFAQLAVVALVAVLSIRGNPGLWPPELLYSTLPSRLATLLHNKNDSNIKSVRYPPPPFPVSGGGLFIGGVMNQGRGLLYTRSP